MRKPAFIEQFSAPLRAMNSVRPGARPIAVDFGVSALRVLKLTPNEPATVLVAGQLATPEEMIDNPSQRLMFQLESLPKVVKTCGLGGSRAACVIPPAQVACKHLKIQPLDNVPLATLVAEHLSDKLGCAPESLLVRHAEVQSAGNQKEVIAYGASRSLVSRLIETMKRAKLEPVGVHNPFDAILQVAPSTDSGASMIIDMGAASTIVMIVNKGEPVFARALEIGSRSLFAGDESLDEARARSLEVASITGSGAGRHQPEIGSPDSKGADPMEILTDELNLCMRYQRSARPDVKLKRALLAGGLANAPGMCGAIHGRLGVETRVLDPLGNLERVSRVKTIGVDLSKPQPGWTTTVGCAMRPTDL